MVNLKRMEKTYSVHETAHILGLCLDSVRRHLRDGKMPGVRVGRQWRITHSQLAAYMGVEALPSPPLQPALTESSEAEPTIDIRGHNEVLAPLLRTAPVRAQVLAIVEQATINTNLRPKKAHYLLDDLDILLR